MRGRTRQLLGRHVLVVARGAIRILTAIGVICRGTGTHIITIGMVTLMLRPVTLCSIRVSLVIMAISTSSPWSYRGAHITLCIGAGLHCWTITTAIWVLRITSLRAWGYAVVMLGIISCLTLICHPLSISRRSGGRRRRHRSSMHASVD